MKKIPGFWLLAMGLALAGFLGPLHAAPFDVASPQITSIIATNKGSTLTLQMRVPPGAHVYAVHLPQGQGPMPSQVVLEPEWVVPLAQLTESPPKRIYDQAYETTLLAHEGDFWVKVRLKQPPHLPLRGVFRYQICSQQLCSLPQDAPFELK